VLKITKIVFCILAYFHLVDVLQGKEILLIPYSQCEKLGHIKAL